MALAEMTSIESSDGPPPSLFEIVSNDALLIVAAFLPALDLCSFAQTSREGRTLAHSPDLFQAVFGRLKQAAGYDAVDVDRRPKTPDTTSALALLVRLQQVPAETESSTCRQGPARSHLRTRAVPLPAGSSGAEVRGCVAWAERRSAASSASRASRG